MRYAFTSGYLAAESIVKNQDYKKLMKQKISGRIKTSVVNRYYCEKGGESFYSFLIKTARKNKNWHNLLKYNCNPTRYNRFMYPFAKWSQSRKQKKGKKTNWVILNDLL